MARNLTTVGALGADFRREASSESRQAGVRPWLHPLIQIGAPSAHWRANLRTIVAPNLGGRSRATLRLINSLFVGCPGITQADLYSISTMGVVHSWFQFIGHLGRFRDLTPCSSPGWRRPFDHSRSRARARSLQVRTICTQQPGGCKRLECDLARRGVSLRPRGVCVTPTESDPPALRGATARPRLARAVQRRWRWGGGRSCNSQNRHMLDPRSIAGNGPKHILCWNFHRPTSARLKLRKCSGRDISCIEAGGKGVTQRPNVLKRCSMPRLLVEHLFALH